MQRFGTIVLGLGAMGSATLYQLAKRGHVVLGVDQFSPPHQFGSSHGDSRVTREAIGEGGEYVALARRSHEIWREIEREIGKELLRTVGCLIISSDAPRATVHVADFFRTTLDTARRHQIPHERLDAAEIRRRYPQFAVRGDEFGYFEPGAGFLRAEECVDAQLQLAKRSGAHILTDSRVEGFEPASAGVRVTVNGHEYAADRLIVSAGAWLPELLGERYRTPFSVSRQVLAWFDLADPASPFLAPDCPVFMWELQGKEQSVYGFPAIDGLKGGVKVASEQYKVTTTAATVDRRVGEDEIAAIYREYVAGYLRGLSGRCIKSQVCLYTNVPGARFVIDQHPEYPRVTVVSPCSGHGFKHSAAIGEALAERIVDGASRIDLSAFSFARVLRARAPRPK